MIEEQIKLMDTTARPAGVSPFHDDLPDNGASVQHPAHMYHPSRRPMSQPIFLPSLQSHEWGVLMQQVMAPSSRWICCWWKKFGRKTILDGSKNVNATDKAPYEHRVQIKVHPLPPKAAVHYWGGGIWMGKLFWKNFEQNFAQDFCVRPVFPSKFENISISFCESQKLFTPIFGYIFVPDHLFRVYWSFKMKEGVFLFYFAMWSLWLHHFFLKSGPAKTLKFGVTSLTFPWKVGSGDLFRIFPSHFPSHF